MSYTSADHRFDAEHAHGHVPARWTERYCCGDCGLKFNVTFIRGQDDQDENCPACGSDYTSA